jgi:hypothetical protein
MTSYFYFVSQNWGTINPRGSHSWHLLTKHSAFRFTFFPVQSSTSILVESNLKQFSMEKWIWPNRNPPRNSRNYFNFWSYIVQGMVPGADTFNMQIDHRVKSFFSSMSFKNFKWMKIWKPTIYAESWALSPLF